MPRARTGPGAARSHAKAGKATAAKCLVRMASRIRLGAGGGRGAECAPRPSFELRADARRLTQWGWGEQPARPAHGRDMPRGEWAADGTRLWPRSSLAMLVFGHARLWAKALAGEVAPSRGSALDPARRLATPVPHGRPPLPKKEPVRRRSMPSPHRRARPVSWPRPKLPRAGAPARRPPGFLACAGTAFPHHTRALGALDATGTPGSFWSFRTKEPYPTKGLREKKADSYLRPSSDASVQGIKRCGTST